MPVAMPNPIPPNPVPPNPVPRDPQSERTRPDEVRGAKPGSRALDEGFDELRQRLHGHPLVLFDGVCRLCDGWVRFVLRRDSGERFFFAPLQSELGQEALRYFGLPPDRLDTVVVVEGDRCSTRSDAVLRIFRHLRAPWPLLSVGVVVPRFLRDWAYGVVARYRYRWFGKRESCALPTPDLQRRFLA